MAKRIIAIILVIMVLGGVVFLTLQSPQQTMKLSEAVRHWIGYKGDPLAFRSDVHLFEYFVVGLVCVVFAWAFGWKLWIGAAIAAGFGLLDEVIKIFLPTREFGAVDLVKDFIGVGVAFGIVSLIWMIRGRKGI